MTDRFEVTARGTRGTLPPPVPGGSAFGVCTACVAVRNGDRLAVLDAGTGIVPLGYAPARDGPFEVDVVQSHAHCDHVMGLPFFLPLHDLRFRVRLWYAGAEGAPDGAALLDAFLRPPFLPFGRRSLKGRLVFAALPQAGTVDLAGGTRLLTAPVNHPGGALVMRLERGGRAFAHVPDFEADFGHLDAALTAALRGADLVFLDATYTPEDYGPHKGWGHAHWARRAEIAAAAGLGRCGLFHHAPWRSDADLTRIAAAASAARPGLFLVREGVAHRL